MGRTKAHTGTLAWGIGLLLLAAGCSGQGGGGPLQTRKCGGGVECGPGAKCEWYSHEAGFKCECDPSGHYFCDAWAGGGSPPWAYCSQDAACGQGGSGGSGGCSQSNGFCSKSCDCDAGCSFECTGNGPAIEDGVVCDTAFCDTEFAVSGGCWVKDGACNYEVVCNHDAPPKVVGDCPP